MSAAPLKRPLSAYMLFAGSERRKPEYAGLSVGDAGKRIGDAWRALDVDGKKVGVEVGHNRMAGWPCATNL